MSPLRSLAVVAVAAVLASSASAGGFGFSYAKSGKHGALGFTWSSGCRPERHALHGSCETVLEKVWVPATRDRVWIPPVHATRYDPCGRPFEVVVACGHWKVVSVPGHYEMRRVRVCRPGFTACH